VSLPAVTSPTPTAAVPAAGSTGAAPTVAAVRRTPCTANRHRRWVFVSLRRQHLWMCARARVVRDTPITSGMSGQYTETPTGTYEIQAFVRHTTLTLVTGEAYPVQYWIPFDAPLFGFHDSSWQRFPYGSPRYRTDGSHGCVHMPLAAIRFLYGWARVGTPVTIRR
jgi:lipoprotein-anchoring transpeptidase ErfK/SrfK